MARIVIIVIVLLLLVGGGYAGWLYFGTGELPQFAEDQNGIAVGQEPDDPFAEYDPDQGIPPNFVELKPFFIPVFEGNRVTRHIELIVFVQASSDAHLEGLRNSANQLQAVFLEELTDYINLLYDETGDIDLYYIKRRLLHVGKREVGADALHGVYIRHIFVRRVS